MEIKIRGLNYLNSGYFSSISICEDVVDDIFKVNVQGFKSDGKIKSFSEEIKDKDSEEKIEIVIQRYLDAYKLYGFTNMVSVSGREGKWNVIYANNCHNSLKLQLFNPRFKKIFNKIFNKYLQDRYNFFWSESFNNIRICFCPTESSYGECCDTNGGYFDGEDFVQINLMLDKEGKFCSFEKKFLTDFLKYRLESIGEEAEIEHIWANKDTACPYYEGTRIYCGDLNIWIPYQPLYDKDIGEIFTVVMNYNYRFNEMKKPIKRQLVMEGYKNE